jgi:hypothetical protein
MYNGTLSFSNNNMCAVRVAGKTAEEERRRRYVKMKMIQGNDAKKLIHL